MTATFAAIDGVVAGDGTGFEKLRVAAGHMPMLADTLAGAIAKQFPDKFTGDTRLGRLRAPGHPDRRPAGARVPGRHRRRHGRVTKDPNSAHLQGRGRGPRQELGRPRRRGQLGLPRARRTSSCASWRKHIGFFVDYTLGKLTNDPAKATKAKADLDGYRADFGALLASANPNLPKDAVAEALIPHVDGHLRRHRRRRVR